MLTDDRIATLSDIGRAIAFPPDRQDELDDLIRESYAAKDGDIYELTAKGQKVLTARGAGLNEA